MMSTVPRRLVAALIGCAFFGLPTVASAGARILDVHAIETGGASGVVFVDAIKQASPWTATGRLRLDVLGNVAALGPGQSAESVVYAPGARYPSGDYALLYAGKGTFEVDGATIVQREPGRAIVRVADRLGLRLRLTATDPSDYARDVRLILPGFEHSYAAQPFSADFIRSLAGADVLYFGAWMHGSTNASSATWPVRPRTDRFTQATADGVAPEYMIALANATGANPWFTLPAGATNYYIFSFAQLVHQQLDPRLHPIFEYGSEAWRPGTPANDWARMAGTNYHLGAAPATAGVAWYALRSKQALSLARSAFGRDAGRVVGVVGTPPVVERITPRVLPNLALRFVPSPAQLLEERPRSGARRTVPPLGKPNYVAQPSARPHLTGMLGMPLEGVDLAREGSADWVHFGSAASVAAVDRRAGALERIGALAVAGSGHVRQTAGFTTFAWRTESDGRQHRSEAGLTVAGTGNGFTLRAPADATERILRLYVGAEHGQGVLRARLSDGSAPVYTSRALRADSTLNGVYSLVYRAAGPGGELVVNYVVDAASRSGARVSVQAATLQRSAVRTASNPSDVVTFHYDNTRSGWDQNETTLTTSNVATGGFGLLQTLKVDGVVLAQPLYVSQYSVPSQGVHNLLIVVTENDTIYEFDADTYQVINQRSMGTAQSSGDIGCNDIRPKYGITDTPVIDRSTNTIYLVAATEPSANDFHHTLHALDIGTLADQKTPVDITASITMSSGGKISFDPQNQQTRTSLFEVGRSIYVGVGSHCDNNASNIVGWLLKYNQSLSQVAAFATAEDSSSYLLTSIWMTGYASAVDSSGNIFTVTGNGAFDANHGGRNYGESVVKLGPALGKVFGYFTPTNWENLNDGDTDFGSGGVMLLPLQQAKPKKLAVAMGKDSKLFLLNRDKLGHVGNALQTLQSSGGGVWGGPAFYSGPTGQFVYYQTDGDDVRAYQLQQTSGQKPMLTQTSNGSSGAGYGGSSPVVSSNGQNPGTGFLWLVKRDSTLTLEAYDATNLGTMLFSESAGKWANPQNNGFVTPLVANGKVYVPATGTVTVFGLP